MGGKNVSDKHGKRYSDEEITIFVEMAQEIGVARAVRELGYPTFTSGMLWMKKRGVELPKSDVMETARAYSQFYKTEDLLAAVDGGMAVVEELFAQCDSADDAKKLSEALQKLANTRLLLEGKANSITEKREISPVDLEIQQMIEKERNKQMNEESFAEITQIQDPK